MASMTSRLQQVQDEVEEVKVIMLDNLNKEEERADKLMDLDDRAYDLCQKSKAFTRTSIKVKKQSERQNKKLKILLASVGVAVVIILIVVVASMLGHSQSSSTESLQGQYRSHTTVSPKLR